MIKYFDFMYPKIITINPNTFMNCDESVDFKKTLFKTILHCIMS